MMTFIKNMFEFSTKGKTLILLPLSSLWIIYNSLKISNYGSHLVFYLCISQLILLAITIIYQHSILPRIKQNKKTLFIPNSVFILASTVIMIVYVLLTPKKYYIDDTTEEILMWLSFGLHILGQLIVIYTNFREYRKNNYYHLPY